MNPPHTATGSHRRLRALALPGALVVAVVGVLLAVWMRSLPAVQDFVRDYPGTTALPPDAPVGLPAWLGWQHYLNALFLLLIVRTGLQVRANPRGSHSWTGVPKANGQPARMTLQLWSHLALDGLWLLNGVIYLVLLFTTGQWMRMIPTDWGVVPNALSAGLQYASLDWPTENGWVNYNSLQLLSYFVIVFVAAPVAILTGIRLSVYWPAKWRRARWYPLALARRLHYPTMIFFVAFIVVHVTLVLTTGALRNLNHIYAARDDTSWIGLVVFLLSSAVIVAAWFALRPSIVRRVGDVFGQTAENPAPRHRPPGPRRTNSPR